MACNVLISVEGKTLGKSQMEFLSREKLWESWISKRLDLREEQRVEAERKLKWDRVWVYALVISIKTETENRLWNTFYAKQNTTFVHSPEARLSPSGPLHQGGMLPLPANPSLQAGSPSQSSNILQSHLKHHIPTVIRIPASERKEKQSKVISPVFPPLTYICACHLHVLNNEPLQPRQDSIFPRTLNHESLNAIWI